jgi:putative DNA primase/helicase
VSGPEEGPTVEDVMDEAIADAAEIARLAKLDPLSLDRELGAAAKRLGCTKTTLRRLVEQARNAGKKQSAGPGSSLGIEDSEPWPEPVNGARLLDDLVDTIGGLVAMSPEACRATALWVAFTHVIAAADTAPRLLVKSPVERCGKSTLHTCSLHCAGGRYQRRAPVRPPCSGLSKRHSRPFS